MLNKIDGFGRKGRRGVVVGGVLDKGTIGWLSPGVGSMLVLLGWRVLELENSSAKVVVHANATGVRDVVPENGYTSVEFMEGLDEVVCIFFAGIFDAKTIHHKGNSDGFGGMLPKVRGAGNGRKAKLRKVRFDAIIGDAPGLFEVGHTLADIHLHPTVGAERLEIVLVNDFGRDAIKCKLHILAPIHLGTIVEVLDVQSHETSVGGGEIAV